MRITINILIQAEPMEETTDPVVPSAKHESELLAQLYEKYSGRDRFIDAFELHSILKELVVGVLDAKNEFRFKISLYCCVMVFYFFMFTSLQDFGSYLNRLAVSRSTLSCKTT